MNQSLFLLLIVGVPSALAFALAAWLFRRRSQAQKRELDTLYKVAEGMITAGDMGEVHRRIVLTLQSILGASHCYLLLHNRVSKQLDVLAGTEPFAFASLPMDAVSGEVTCFRNKAVLEVPDAEHCPFVDREVVRRLGQKSVLYVPVRSEGEVIGVLEVDARTRKRVFTEEQKACAQHVANLGALAMKLCEQRSMREHLFRTEKMAAAGELIAGVAQDLKSPLAAMGGLAELALARSGGPTAQELRGIQAEAQRASAILQRLLSFAQPQKPGPKVVDVNAVLRAVASLREEKWQQRGIEARLQLSPVPPMIHSEPEHLEQVFLNLLINAEGALELAPEKTITVRTTIAAKRVLISISDTGAGLTSDRLLYDSIRPTRTAGLGMAVCQSLIEGHGGSIRLRTAVGHGTTFEIEYPLAVSLEREAPAPSPAEGASVERLSSSLTALVIDEDQRVQESLLSMLSDREYRVIVVGSAEEALDLAERARFDLVLCDAHLRGMGGIELYQRIRQRIQTFVFLTDAFNPELREMFGDGDQAVLAKPFTAADVEALLEAVEPRLLEAHAGPPAGW